MAPKHGNDSNDVVTLDDIMASGTSKSDLEEVLKPSQDPLLGEGQRLAGFGSVKDSFDTSKISERATEPPMADGSFQIGDKFRSAKVKDIHFRWVITFKDHSRYEMTKERVSTELKPTGTLKPGDLPDFIDYDALDLEPLGPGKIQPASEFELAYGAWIQEGDQTVYDMDGKVVDVVAKL